MDELEQKFIDSASKLAGRPISSFEEAKLILFENVRDVENTKKLLGVSEHWTEVLKREDPNESPMVKKIRDITNRIKELEEMLAKM